MDKDQQIATWVVTAKGTFCDVYQISHEDFLQMNRKYSLLHYLFDNYELLHYFADQAIAEDMAEYIRRQGGNIQGVS